MPINNKQFLSCIYEAQAAAKLEVAARQLDCELVPQSTPETLLEQLSLEQPRAVLIELSHFGPEAMSFLAACRQQAPNTAVIAILAHASPQEVTRFLSAGFSACLPSSSATDEILYTLERINSQMTTDKAAAPSMAEPWRNHLVGQSLPMEQVSRVIRLVASRRCTILISGETGSGKEMAARAIHLASNRSHRPMVSLNCGAIPENLIEAELFGHIKGAFTGAVNSRIGRFEQAQGGTLFLDEIADLPFDLQAKLLRVLQEREIQRLGSSETVKVDVRVIAATNANLLHLVQQGRFREDLYYRLNVVPLRLPALRDRLTDVPLLVNHFVRKICQAEGLPVKDVNRDAMDGLCDYAWPGNVRQLENVVEHAVVMSGERGQLHAYDFLLPRSADAKSVQPISVPAGKLPAEGLDYAEALRQFELAILQQALSRAQGNKTMAADMLRLPRTTLIHKLRVLQYVAA